MHNKLLIMVIMVLKWYIQANKATSKSIIQCKLRAIQYLSAA